MWCSVLAPLLLLLLPPPGGRALFYTGRVQFGDGEYPELAAHGPPATHGWMTVRQAVLRCETDPECAGFTFKGSRRLDGLRRVAFFRYIMSVYTDYQNLDWNFYAVERDFSVYKGRLPTGGGNVFQEFRETEILGNRQVETFCQTEPNCTAVSLGHLGQMRVYSRVDIASLALAPGWTTYLDLEADAHQVVSGQGLGLGQDRDQALNRCCPESSSAGEQTPPWEGGLHNVPRVSCAIPEADFTDLFVRTSTPALLVGCDYRWLDEHNLTVEQVVRAYHDNSTRMPPGKLFRRPAPGFTHIRTPNDNVEQDDDVIEALASGYLRSFNRLRHNPSCQLRANSTCHVFETFPKPGPIPEDIYPKTNYANDLDWVIVSQEGTGSHPHHDPDLTGAWNYLINGYKWWVIFPDGVHHSDVSCEKSCSEGMDDIDETFRWFHRVLPQLRGRKFYGQPLTEFVQGPGDVVFIPHGLLHSVLNIRDNVAVTENYLFVDSLPELMTRIVLDEISAFRPGWEARAYKKIYNQLATAEDRLEMRHMYEEAVRKASPEICARAEENRNRKWKEMFEEVSEAGSRGPAY